MVQDFSELVSIGVAKITRQSFRKRVANGIWMALAFDELDDAIETG